MEVCKVTSHEKNKIKNKKATTKQLENLKRIERKMAVPLEYVISRP